MPPWSCCSRRMIVSSFLFAPRVSWAPRRSTGGSPTTTAASSMIRYLSGAHVDARHTSGMLSVLYKTISSFGILRLRSLIRQPACPVLVLPSRRLRSPSCLSGHHPPHPTAPQYFVCECSATTPRLRQRDITFYKRNSSVHTAVLPAVSRPALQAPCEPCIPRRGPRQAWHGRHSQCCRRTRSRDSSRRSTSWQRSTPSH